MKQLCFEVVWSYVKKFNVAVVGKMAFLVSDALCEQRLLSSEFSLSAGHLEGFV